MSIQWNLKVQMNFRLILFARWVIFINAQQQAKAKNDFIFVLNAHRQEYVKIVPINESLSNTKPNNTSYTNAMDKRDAMYADEECRCSWRRESIYTAMIVSIH